MIASQENCLKWSPEDYGSNCSLNEGFAEEEEPGDVGQIEVLDGVQSGEAGLAWEYCRIQSQFYLKKISMWNDTTRELKNIYI